MVNVTKKLALSWAN